MKPIIYFTKRSFGRDVLLSNLYSRRWEFAFYVSLLVILYLGFALVDSRLELLTLTGVE